MPKLFIAAPYVASSGRVKLGATGGRATVTEYPYPEEWHRAARAVLNRHDGSWGITNAQADAVLTSVVPLIRAAVLREARATTLREAAYRAEHGPSDGYELVAMHGAEIGDWLAWLADESEMDDGA